MNMKLTAILRGHKINSPYALLIFFSIASTILFWLDQFLVIWSNGDIDDGCITVGQNGTAYMTGMVIRKGWGPFSEHELGGSHPMAIICLLIPVIILVLLLMKKTSAPVYKCMAVMVFVDLVAWQIIRSKIAKLADRYDLDFETTPLFVFNMIFLICMFVIILAGLLKKATPETYIKDLLMVNKDNNSSKMVYRYCENCGNELKSSHIFCTSCGKKIEWDI